MMGERAINTPTASETVYDVAIIGGALAGAATAILLLREQPNLRVIIIEKSTVFGRRVGEATVEVSGYFLGRVLGLTQYLNEAHLVKQGMRFWFVNDRARSLDECSEIGGRYLSRIPAYQVDRAALDEEVLRRAIDSGATLLRPARVFAVRLVSGGDQIIEIKQRDQSRRLLARWVVDASGVAALLARQEGWWRPNPLHPTTAVWARWTGVKDWDGFELAKKYPEWSMACQGIRTTATNHFTGPGWWAWCIPLKGGDVSIGVVFDQRLVTWPEEGPLGERLKSFLMRHPAAREVMADAQWRDGDVHWRKNLAYYSTTFAGDGFVLVGDAAAFLDPFYSPGMDWISFTASAAADLISPQVEQTDLARRIQKHNHDFGQSYQRWFQALYQDKYEYIGDFDLMRLAFLLDLGLYYLGVASQPYKRGGKALVEPVFSTPPSAPFFHFIRTYNRRFAQIARSRRERNQWGKHNDRSRFLFKGYTFSSSSAWPLARALTGWFALELREGWRTWFASRSAELSTPLQPTAKESNAGLGMGTEPTLPAA
jgi:flavin-dependent dehydrogenase